MDITELESREGIRDLVTRYNSNGDSGRFEQVMELFTDDAVMEVPGGIHRGKEEILTIFTGTRSRLDEASTDTPGYVRHYTATHQIDLIDESRANGRLYYQVLTPIGLDHWGRYMDQYRRVDGRWLFAHRKVTNDGQSPGSLFPAAAD
jgi:uncharacterized protein (TIGR02246 family)